MASFLQDWTQPVHSIVQPMVYDQRLLICNTYEAESESPVSLSRNGDLIFIEGEALNYGECRYAPSTVRKGDKLDFKTTDNMQGGTFEVTDLPEEDAMLLLVLQNNGPITVDSSRPMASQSYTFPLHVDGKAELAVVDATNKKGVAALHISKLAAKKP